MPATRPETTPVSDAARTAVSRLEEYVEWTGLEMLCVDCNTQQIVAKSHSNLPDDLPLSVRANLNQVREIDLIEAPPNFLFFRVPLPSDSSSRFIAIGGVHAETPRIDVVIATTTAGERWTDTDAVCSPKMLRALLASALRRGELEDESRSSSSSPAGGRLKRSHDEIRLLNGFASLLHVARDARDLAELCLKQMRDMLDMGGSAIWLQETHRVPTLLRQGRVPFDELELAHLISRFTDHSSTAPLVRNNLKDTPLAEDFPGLLNLVIVPIGDGRNRRGWIVGCNCRTASGRGFGDAEVGLVRSIATILETHIRNTDLYRSHEDLILSFVRSLVSTLDAKDPYTRGHSQRVAHIARRLGEELGLDDRELQDLYLAGLLHDLGKVAIDDATLRKPGELTEEEFQAIKEHPVIGYQILEELTNLKTVLPGVRNHHEAYDGSGYPDGLSGDTIPLMARILAVADSYDAMTSDRPYRIGLPVEHVEKIFRSCSGRQWDPDIVDAYFACRDDIREICEEFSPSDPLLLQAPVSMADVLFHA